MRILFCCEFYAPSVGGVQEVMRQLAERLVKRGHAVTVATTRLSSRKFALLNGVTVREYAVSGNFARGMRGRLGSYRRLAVSGAFDVVMIKAAQQWTFDALWPVLREIKSAKVFIPCGFSGLYEPAYAEYFSRLPDILRHFDHLIFYASDYRDINFARAHGLTRFSVIPNGAAEEEFSAAPDPSFRQRRGLAPDELLFLTVGSLSPVKGHLEVAKAFLAADLGAQPATLIVNGHEGAYAEDGSPWGRATRKVREYNRVMTEVYRAGGFPSACGHFFHGLLNKAGVRRGRYAVRDSPGVTFRQELQDVIDQIHRQGNGKRVLVADLPRPELVQAYLNADLFVFASHVEYSPLVLFEAAAAGTPFLSVPVGNAEEIARWTGAGVICPAPQDDKGYIRVDPKVLGEHWSRLVKDGERLRRLGDAGRRNWAARFTWERITSEYERVFESVSAAP